MYGDSRGILSKSPGTRALRRNKGGKVKFLKAPKLNTGPKKIAVAPYPRSFRKSRLEIVFAI